MRYLPALLALFALGGEPEQLNPPAPGRMQAQSVPPLTEESWSFQDNGNTYFVGKSTGRLLILRGESTPDPQPAPQPPPVPSVKKVAWVSLICDPSDAIAAAYRTDPQARLTLSRAGVEFRTYVATERDIDILGFRSIVTDVGLPLVVTQDKDGAVISTRQIQDGMDWQIFYTGINQ